MLEIDRHLLLDLILLLLVQIEFEEELVADVVTIGVLLNAGSVVFLLFQRHQNGFGHEFNREQKAQKVEKRSRFHQSFIDKRAGFPNVFSLLVDPNLN